MNASEINFEKNNGLVPCIIQDNVTMRVLMLGYMNQEALEKTKREKRVTFFSRTKNRLWMKGETSGNYFDLVDIIVDCDQDTLLIKVNPRGPACHTGADTCFNESNANPFDLTTLESIITERKSNPKKGSYTTSLFESGVNKIAQKVGEEAVELIIEAKDNNKDLFLNEAADLLYHYLVLVHVKGFRLASVLDVLKSRRSA